MKQKGFSLVEGLLIVLVLSIIGLSGYYVWSQNRDNDAEVVDTVTKTGTVDRISPDCEADRFLDADGNIKTSNSFILCDNGNSITVDGVQYRTSSGNVPPDKSWGIDTRGIEPGDRVEVIAAMNIQGEYNDLSCSACYLRKIE